MKYAKKELYMRSIVLAIGLVIMAFGVALSIRAGLGTSPISSLPYAISCFGFLTVGTATIIMHIVLISLQIIILGKEYEKIQLVQLPVGILFGYLIDIAMMILPDTNTENYMLKVLLCAGGIILVAVGVSLEVAADVTVLAGEGFVIAMCRKWNLNFGNTKVCFDCILVIIAVIISLIGLGRIEGVREGTVAAAIFVGIIARQLNRYTVNAVDTYSRK